MKVLLRFLLFLGSLIGSTLLIEVMVFMSMPHGLGPDEIITPLATLQLCVFGAYLVGSIPTYRLIPDSIVIGVILSSFIYRTIEALLSIQHGLSGLGIESVLPAIYFLFHHLMLIAGLVLAIRWPLEYVLSQHHHAQR